MNDRKLVDDFLKNRSERAFRVLYRSKTPGLYQIALRLTAHNKGQAEELIQEMWIIALKGLHAFQWRSELRTWLTGILINLSRQWRKKEEQRTMADSIDIQETELPDFNGIDLENAIAQLPEGYRQVIILHDIEGYKHREIAEIMDISEGTSKSQLYHARRTMRYLLTENAKK